MPDDDEQHDALTAFQLARRKGYRFSEQRWLESLKGERGERGEKGDRGDRGPRGLNGDPGLHGRDGRDGINGKDGLNGIDGIDGALPPPVRWKGTFERDAQRLVKKIRLKADDGVEWDGNVSRDNFGAMSEVEFVPIK